MNTATPKEVMDVIIRWVRDNRLPIDSPGLEISEDTDLMAEGLLDSFGFVDLVLFIEQQTGLKVTLADADPSEFTVIKGLCKIVLSNQTGESQEQVDLALGAGLQRSSD